MNHGDHGGHGEESRTSVFSVYSVVKKKMVRRYTLLLVLVGYGFNTEAQGQEAEKAFAILKTNCLACHDTKMHAGNLIMETTAGLLKGGAKGPAVLPGKSAESRLIKMVLGEVAPKMPLEGDLKPAEIETLRRWIDAGAPAWKTDAIDSEPLNVPDIKPKIGVRPQVSSLAYSPDGRTLAAAGYREVRLLDAASLKMKAVLSGPTDAVRALAYSPDGGILAAAGGNPARYGEIVLWDAKTGNHLRTLRGHRDYIYALAFSPDGKSIASSSYDRLIKIWDAQSGAELKTLKEHIDAVFPIAFSPDGKRLASGSADRTVKIWDLASGRRVYTLSDSTDVIFTLAFHASGQRLSAAGADKYIRTWNVGTDAGTLSQSIIAHEAEITTILYFPDGKRLVSTGADRAVKIWNMEKGEVITSLETQPDWALSMAVSPDGNVLAIGRYDGSVSCYDASTGRPVISYSPQRRKDSENVRAVIGDSFHRGRLLQSHRH